MDNIFLAIGFGAAGLGVFVLAAGLVYLFGGKQVRQDMRGE